MMNKRVGEHGKFQNFNGMLGGWGGGGEECTHDNEGREWTGQFAKGEQQMQLQPSKQ